jgi:hypothetical protein
VLPFGGTLCKFGAGFCLIGNRITHFPYGIIFRLERQPKSQKVMSGFNINDVRSKVLMHITALITVIVLAIVLQ